MHRTRPARGAIVLSSVCLGTLSACGSPPPPAAPAPPPALAAAPAQPTPPDLAATPEPEGLVVFARVAKPSEALKVIGGWVQMPMPGPGEIGSLVTGESTANLIDLDQPIDFALTMDGREPHGAISAAIKSIDEARLTFSKYKLVPADNGGLRVEGLGKPDDQEKEGDGGEARVCELMNAFGPATTRLVCAESEKTLRELGPWLVRTAPRSSFPADVHLEVRFAPVRPLVTQMRRVLPMFAGSALGIRHTGVPDVDEAFRAAIDDLADFTSDADTIAIDGMLGEPQATITLGAKFRSTTSLLARLAVSHPERAAAPPASFWKLPADADIAFFHSGIDPADFEHPRDHVADVISAGLAQGGLADADRKAIRDAASHTLDLFAVRSEYAKGLDVDAAEKAIKAIPHASGAAKDEGERVAAEKMAGWFVVGLDAPAAKVGALEKEWATAWGRPGVAKWVRSKATDAPAPLIRMAPVPKGIAGTDAAHLEMVVYSSPHEVADASGAGGNGNGNGNGNGKSAKKPPPGKPLVLHALVVPDGNASWLVFAADEALAVAKAKEVLAGGTLASRPGLGSMKDARMNAGGFVTTRSFAVEDVFGWVLAPKWGSLARDPIGWIASAPDQAATPIPYQLAAQPGGGASPAGTFTATTTVPKAAIGEIVRRAMH